MPKGVYERTEYHKQFGFKKGNTYGKKMAGKNHGNWKGGYKYKKSRGLIYRMKLVGTRKYYAEHRWVMEQYLGRKLRKDEAVHHKDGDTLNNDIGNLEVLSWEEHKNKHKGSYKYPNFKCVCGKTKHWAKGKCRKCYDRNYYLSHKNE